MAHPALQIPDVTTGRALEVKQERHARDIQWCCGELAGRLVELRNSGSSATLTFAMTLILDAQHNHLPVAWIAADDTLFYPPDVIDAGVELSALPVVLVRGAQAAARAADKLLRSDAFGLIIVDLGADAWFPTPLQNRLVRLAERHDTAVVLLTEENRNGRLPGPPMSLRAEAHRSRIDPGRFRCSLDVIKDRRRGPNWSHEEDCHGTTGLR